MNATTVTGKELVAEYFDALSGKPKTAEVVNRYVSDLALREHIVEAEAAFPEYQLVADQMIAEGDTVAVRGTFSGTHLGSFMGIPATGKQVSVGLMLFYRISNGSIVEHWMQLDGAGLMGQLTGA